MLQKYTINIIYHIQSLVLYRKTRTESRMVVIREYRGQYSRENNIPREKPENFPQWT